MNAEFYDDSQTTGTEQIDAVLQQIRTLPAAQRRQLLDMLCDQRFSAVQAIGHNLALSTDSYKASHFLQYPPGSTGLFSYIESRGGRYEQLLFFGLQMILKEYFSTPITWEDIEAADLLWRDHGLPFNRRGFEYIVRDCGGFFPLKIRALPEGSAVAPHIPLVTIECVDPQAYWSVSYIEALMLQLWYPTTVATLSWHCKETIRQFLVATADDPENGLAFKLHDFGYRGSTSPESAARAGLAHLVNFLGTDTIVALEAARRYYGVTGAAGFSIPAAEHSTITSWGRAQEQAAYSNMLDQFAKPGATVAVVSDSYDIFHAVDEIWGKALKQRVIDSGATIVIRPDSGEPVRIVREVTQRLDRAFGSRVNGKGYRVLNHVRIIQGDGINQHSIRDILADLMANGYSADNIAFGIGGALHQSVNRDTCRFAMKCSAIRIGSQWREVYKDPITDPGKRSKGGRLGVLRNTGTGELLTRVLPEEEHDDSPVIVPGAEWEDALLTVWEHGELVAPQHFDGIRARANAVRAPVDAFAGES